MPDTHGLSGQQPYDMLELAKRKTLHLSSKRLPGRRLEQLKR